MTVIKQQKSLLVGPKCLPSKYYIELIRINQSQSISQSINQSVHLLDAATIFSVVPSTCRHN